MEDRMLALAGRVAVVTGGGRGIGAATAVALAQAGASVAVVARSQEQVGTVAEILASQGARSLAVAADVADPAAIADAFVKIANMLGPIDVLINNASVVAPLGPTVRSDPEAWQAALPSISPGPSRASRLSYPG
jgi:NAD(P)-dependent dehydrogenase (short-subunit alcohol dehydrogenase family)